MLTLEAPCCACSDGLADLPRLACLRCRDAVRDGLTDLETWYDRLLEPIRRRASGMPTTKHCEPPSPLSDHAGAVRADIISSLTRWVLDHHDHHPDAPLPDFLHTGEAADIRALVNYLDTSETWLLSQEAMLAQAYVEEIVALAAKAIRTAAPGRREGVIIAEHVVADETCGPVWAKNITGTARCSGCGLKLDVEQWFAEAPPADSDLLTDEVAAGWVAFRWGQLISTTTLRTWSFRDENLRAARRRSGGRSVTARGAIDAFMRERLNQIDDVGRTDGQQKTLFANV
ncbi:hypothetical protein JCM9957A_16530 [Kineosporia succinea]|nr:hypothetical protein [Kineosporia succinea]